MIEKTQKIYDKFLQDARPVLVRCYGKMRAEEMFDIVMVNR